MRRTSLVATCVALALATAACGGSGRAKPTATGATTAAPVPTSSSVAPVATGDSGNPADIAAIRAAYRKFLDPKIPVAQKTGLIQDGPAFLDAMQAESKNPAASTVSIQLTSVRVTSADRADVVFTLLVGGSPLLTGQKGNAVRENGTWRVAGATFCGLLAAQGPASVPKACYQAAATSLPS